MLGAVPTWLRSLGCPGLLVAHLDGSALSFSTLHVVPVPCQARGESSPVKCQAPTPHAGAPTLGTKWGQQSGHGEGNRPVENPRSLPGNLESKILSHLPGK